MKPLTPIHNWVCHALAGGNAAANAMNEECRRRNVNCCVIGVPKSIDNDILLIDRCFGFETAVAEAKKALLAAKVEARSAYRCASAAHVCNCSVWDQLVISLGCCV